MLLLFIGFAVGVLLGGLILYVLLSREHAKYVLEKEKELITLMGQVEAVKSEAASKEVLQSEKFETFAHELLKRGTQSLQETSASSLENILKPLRLKLGEFEAKVEKVYESEARERFNLKKEIERMAFASENLGRALRGDIKTQGIWGEIVLEKVLETSGLREGIGYTTQGRDMNLKNTEGFRFKPDVIIHLPEGRSLVIDSKVSLGAFERWVNNTVPAEREAAHKLFTSAVRTHVQSLGDKNYQNLEGLQSPDFVFLFFPIDAALVSLYEKDPEIFNLAWQKKVVIVGPSTLLPMLKTVDSIWRNEKQNQNALEIARLGGRLYDKFVSFCEDLVGVGRSLGQAQNSYDEALKKLKDGKDNLFRQTERLRELGVRSQKVVPRELAAAVEISGESSGDQ